MSTNLQDLLREGLDRATAGASVPDGLVRRAQQHNRQRQIRVRATIAASTAVAAAAAVVTVSLAATGNKPGNPPVRTQTLADVVTRTDQALTAAVGQGKAIQVTRMSSPNTPFGLTVIGPQGVLPNSGSTQPLPGAPAAVLAQHQMSWQYRDLTWQEGFSAAGRLVFVNAYGPIRLHSGKQVPGNYGAAYPVHVRWRSVRGGTSGPAPKLACQTFPTGYPSWRATIVKALSCGIFQLSGWQHVDGVDAIKLTSRPLYGGRETLWINPVTYLPVRLIGTELAGPSRGLQMVTDFRFLPPTKANLAMLHAAVRRAPIPATFRLLPPKYLILAGGV